MSKYKIPEAFHDFIYRLYGCAEKGLKVCRSVTFVVTEDCCLKCTYCYETHKTKKRMTFETGKQIVDCLFDMYDANEPDGFINHDTKSIILEFIGGEPMLEIKLIGQIVDYFWRKALERRHIWADTFKVSMTSNGVLFFTPEVQEYLEKYGSKTNITVTIDGDKEMHDKCRKHHDGSGSWEEAYAAEKAIRNMNHDTEPGTKVTISPENLPYLYQTFMFFKNEGYKEINANVIYEHKWTEEESYEFYKQLIQIADVLIESEVEDPENGHIYCSLFSDFFFKPIPDTDNGTWCGGSGEMLSFDTEGYAYPCIRYMEMSLNGEQEPLIIGDCFRGIYKDKCEKKLLEELKGVNRRSQNTDECYYCPIAKGCSSCTAWDYQSSGSLYKRSMNICNSHKARSLANVYYWNTLYQKTGQDKKFDMNLPKEDALKIIPEEEYMKLAYLAE